MGLNENRKRLLRKGIRNGGWITFKQAERVYSSRSAAESAIDSMVSEGWIRWPEGYEEKLLHPSQWRIVKVPPELKQEVKN